MTVAGDGNDAGNPDKRASSSRRARHRVPPAASGSSAAPLLPEPFSPAKPTFPAVPRQRRRNGPTAIATAAVPEAADGAAVPYQPQDEGDPATVGTLAGEARANAAAVLDAEPTVGEFDAAPTQGLEFVVSFPGAPSAEPDEEAHAAPGPATVTDPAPAPSPDADSAKSPAAPVDLPAYLPAEPAVGAAPVPKVTATAVVADDSPTVADYVPPAIAIVTDEPHEDDLEYRGSRRKIAAWRRYPVGAVAVAVVILLITGAVVAQLVRGDSPDTPSSERVPQRVPGINGLPGVPPADSPSPSLSGSSSAAASPSASRSRSASPSTTAAQPASPSAVRTTSQPPPAQPVSGRVVGVASNKCMEYRAGDHNRVVLDMCDRRGNQRWTVQGDGTVRADAGCLEVMNAGTGNGNAVQVFTCNGTPAQQWTVRGDGTWQNPRSGRCLAAANGGTGAGTPLIIWDCFGTSSQRWTLTSF